MPYIFAWFLLRKGYSRSARVVGFSWMFIGLLGLMVNKVPHTKSPDFDPVAAAQQRAQLKAEQEAREIEALPLYKASELARAYADNTVAADQEFKGKRFKVTGTVDAINTDFLGKPYVSLRGGVNQFMEPQFAFDKDQVDDLAELRKGMKVTWSAPAAATLPRPRCPATAIFSSPRDIESLYHQGFKYFFPPRGSRGSRLWGLFVWDIVGS